MRTHVTFQHPAEFVPASEDDGILSITGIEWFLTILRRIPELAIDPNLCQEDWGVVVFASRDNKHFWIGVSPGPGLGTGNDEWIAHIHHGITSWMQRVVPSGARALERLANDLHAALRADSLVADVTWFTERELRLPSPQGAPSPGAA